jgi:hypothetical protein
MIAAIARTRKGLRQGNNLKVSSKSASGFTEGQDREKWTASCENTAVSTHFVPPCAKHAR